MRRTGGGAGAEKCGTEGGFPVEGGLACGGTSGIGGTKTGCGGRGTDGEGVLVNSRGGGERGLVGAGGGAGREAVGLSGVRGKKPGKSKLALTSASS